MTQNELESPSEEEVRPMSKNSREKVPVDQHTNFKEGT